MAIRVKPVANRIEKLKQWSAPAVEAAALGFSMVLDDNYAFGPRSGKKDYRTGRARSVPGEYPQEQSGQLRSAIYYREANFGNGSYWNVGFDTALAIRSSLRHQAELGDYLAYIEGLSRTGASRFGLAMTGESAQTHSEMLMTIVKLLKADRFKWGR